MLTDRHTAAATETKPESKEQNAAGKCTYVLQSHMDSDTTLKPRKRTRLTSLSRLSKSRCVTYPLCHSGGIEYVLQVTLADQQADPNSPLYSAKTFEQLGLSVSLANLYTHAETYWCP